jgi:hypothetical protein
VKGLATAMLGAMLLFAPSGPGAPSSGAYFNAVEAATAGMASDTLQPPTAMTASGGSSATLGWTPSADAYASGYRVLSATASGGAYTEIGTATPIAATGYVDSPTVDGTYWYKARTFFGNWLSADADPVSASVLVGDTGYHACSAQAADTGGDGNGYQGTPANACADDSAVATDTNSGSGTSTVCTNSNKDRHRFSDFGLGVPLTATAVSGISVRVKVGIDAISGTNLVCAQLSWDAGTTWTTTQSVALTATALTSYTLGGTTFLWGRTWTAAQLTDATFRLRLIDVSSSTLRDYSLDAVEVRVTYTP